MNYYDERGGTRPNSGRNKISDKKVQVYAGVRQSIINLLGIDEVKRLMTEGVKWNGQCDEIIISLNADMKVVHVKGHGLIELQWDNGICYFNLNGKRYNISQFGRCILD